jgi:hypothetical protein
LILAERTRTVARDCKGRMKGEPRLGGSLRLLKPFKMSKGCGGQEVREREIAVRLNGAAQPHHRFLVAAENELRCLCLPGILFISKG